MKYNQIKTIVNSQGYLINFEDWNEKLAIEIARLEKIILVESHWQVVYFMRTFYIKFNISPPIRMLVKAMTSEYGFKKFNSSYLFYLFPLGPAQQATKIAGLPKPINCL